MQIGMRWIGWGSLAAGVLIGIAVVAPRPPAAKPRPVFLSATVERFDPWGPRSHLAEVQERIDGLVSQNADQMQAIIDNANRTIERIDQLAARPDRLTADSRQLDELLADTTIADNVDEITTDARAYLGHPFGLKAGVSCPRTRIFPGP